MTPREKILTLRFNELRRILVSSQMKMRHTATVVQDVADALRAQNPEAAKKLSAIDWSKIFTPGGR